MWPFNICEEYEINILREVDFRSNTYVLFEHNSMLYSGMKVRGVIPIICDLAKQHFNLPMTGSIIGKVGKERVFIQRVYSTVAQGTLTKNYKNEKLVFQWDIPLGDESLNNNQGKLVIYYLRNLIRKFYVFRDALNITPTHSNSLAIRILPEEEKDPEFGRYTIISLDESRVFKSAPSPILKKITLDKWFQKHDINEVAKEMMKISSMQTRLSKLQDEIQKIDKQYIWIPSMITSRMTNRLV